jgi:beta-glucanase (GH16 family)
VNPFSVSNGVLDITASPGSNPLGLAYNSGVISTQGDFTQTYGYFEMRAELPQGAGMWPGFWLLSADQVWPPEIDALEAFGAPNAHGEGGANQMHYAVHALNPQQNDGGWATIPGNIYTAYHTYGVDWEADFITYYVDGQQVGRVTTPAEAHKPMFLLANLAVGGTWPGLATGETGQMQIDYIRAYSTDPTTHAVALQTVSSLDGIDTTPYGTTTATGTVSRPGTLTLHVSEDAWNGNAQFNVFVDGHQVGGTQTITASHALGQWQDITLTGAFGTGAHTIDVSFINDGWGGNSTLDRNMYVQSIDINGQHILGTTALHAPDAGKGALHDTSAAVFLNNGTGEFLSTAATTGTSSSTGTTQPVSSDKLVLHVSEDAWNGNAQFTVSVDGHQIGGTQTITANHGLGQWQDIALTGDFAPGVNHTVAVTFLNDGWGGTSALDRNMYVQYVDINGEHILGTSETGAPDAGKAALHDTNAAVFLNNGTASFAATGTPTTPMSTMTLHVSEDAWTGDAQFIVSVDGHQLGGVQTATASHALGQVQDITFTGDWGALGPSKVDITFLNDGWGGSSTLDRNLYVQSLDINGVHFAGDTALHAPDAGKGALHDATAAVFLNDGTAEFAINHTAPAADYWHV